MIRQDDRCHRCAAPSREEDRFCRACGTSLEVPRCVMCSQRVSPGSRFCGACGAPLLLNRRELAQPDEEQLRQVTVIFVQLEGLEELMERHSPEEGQEKLSECFRHLSREVVERGGIIDKYMTSSMLALFGTPVAHEDDVARAVEAAVAMREAFESLCQRMKLSAALGIRIGINTGKVLVGYVAADVQDLTVLGDVVNTASRIQQAAPIGGILVGEASRRLCGERFALELLPPLRVKGKEQPLAVFRLLTEESLLEAVPPPLSTPMIGRQFELNTLVEYFRLTLSQRAGVSVALWAEAGMGKNRFLREFMHYAALDPSKPRVILTEAHSMREGEGSEVLGRLLLTLAGGLPQEGPQELRERLFGLARGLVSDQLAWGVTPEGVAGVLSWLAGIPGSAALQSPPLDAQVYSLRRSQAISLVRALLERLALERPLLLVATQLQWADEVSLDFLEALGQAPPRGLMLVAAARPSLRELRPRFDRRFSKPSLELPPLTQTEVVHFVHSLSESTPLSATQLRDLHAFTGGNPHYLLETLQSMKEHPLGKTLEASALTVPDSIESVLQARIDRLSLKEALVLRTAALSGARFSAGALSHVLGFDPSGSLEILIRRGFVKAVESAKGGPDVEYRFMHPIAARVAEGNLLEPVRRRYHLAYAEYLLAHAGSPPNHAELAHHLMKAGAFLLGAVHYARAGEIVLSLDRSEEALRIFDRALEAEHGTEGFPDGFRAHLLLKRGEARWRLGQLSGALADLMLAVSSNTQSEDADEVALGWYLIAAVHGAQGNWPQAREAITTGKREERPDASPEIRAMGLQLRAELLYADGRLDEVLQPLEAAIQLRRKLGDRSGLARGLNALGRLFLARGDVLKARGILREVAELQERLVDLHGLAQTLFQLGLASESMGAYAESLGQFHRSGVLSLQLREEQQRIKAVLKQGVGYLRCGFFGRAQRSLTEAMAFFESSNRPLEAAQASYNLALLEMRLDNPTAALALADQTLLSLEGSEASDAIRAPLNLIRGHALRSLKDLEGAWDEAEKVFLQGSRLEQIDLRAAALHLQSLVALEQGASARAWDCLEELEWMETYPLAVTMHLETMLLAGSIRLKQGQGVSALSRFREAAELTLRHDLAPGRCEALVGIWRCHLWLKSTSVAAAAKDVEEAYREFLARVEEPTLVERMRSRALRERWPVPSWPDPGAPTAT